MIQLFYSENIKELMKWQDKQYLLFISSFDQAFNYYKPTDKSKIYDDNYLEYSLSLFFIINQLSYTINSPKIYNNRALFLTYLCYYLVEENHLQTQTQNSIEHLKVFFQNLQLAELIPESVVVHAIRILNYHIDKETIASDDGSYSDYRLLTDLILSSDPVLYRQNGRAGIMRFPFSYRDIKFRVGNNPPTPQDFFSSMHKVCNRIQSNYLRYNYLDRLTTVMDLQSKGKLIFKY
jgi:hypothetical protein